MTISDVGEAGYEVGRSKVLSSILLDQLTDLNNATSKYKRNKTPENRSCLLYQVETMAEKMNELAFQVFANLSDIQEQLDALENTQFKQVGEDNE